MKFGLRISRVLPSFRSCRLSTKDDTLPRLSPPVPSPPPPTPPHLVPVVSCSRCSCRSFSRSGQRRDLGCGDDKEEYDDGVYPSVEVVPAYLWRKEDKWHVVVNPRKMQVFSPRRSKIDSDDGGDLFPPLSIPKPSYRKSKKGSVKNNGRKRKNNKKISGSKARVSNSSVDTRLFSTNDDEDREYEEGYDFDEAETRIYSSHSFSTNAELQCKNQISPEKTESSPTSTLARSSSSLSTSSLLLRRRLRSMSSSCTGSSVERKVRESFAVVKKSDHPYEDFRRSMMEMVVQKQIYEVAELEELLRCFLSLNSSAQHRTIFRAFSEVCSSLYGIDGDDGSLPVDPLPADVPSPLFVNKSMTC